MYEDTILKTLEAAHRPMSIAEVKEALTRQLKGKVSYETTKKDLITLSAKGLINSKSIGKGKRVTWIFWALNKEQPHPQVSAKMHKPFSVSITERDNMNPKELATLYDLVVKEYGDLIKGNLGKHSRYIVFCDGKIVYASSHEPSDEQVRDLENKLGKVCYVLTEDPIEECAWSPIGNADYYPTIDVHIGNAHWKEKEVFDRGLKITSDFDTGDPDIAAFSNDDLKLTQPTAKRLMRRAFHLGRHYDYYLLPLKICIEDSLKVRRCIQKQCRSVLSWTAPNRNPFLLANPNRRGFVGRDMMLTFPLSILLSGRNRQSKVLIEGLQDYPT